MIGLIGAQLGPWLTSANCDWVLAVAERFGFVREPSLDEATYARYRVADAVEALGWMHERGLLNEYGIPVTPSDGWPAVDPDPAFV